MRTAQAQIEAPSTANGASTRKRARLLDGDEEGIAFCLDGYAEIGEIVTVRYHPDDQFARVVREEES